MRNIKSPPERAMSLKADLRRHYCLVFQVSRVVDLAYMLPVGQLAGGYYPACATPIALSSRTFR
jgi:hypothetical protein